MLYALIKTVHVLSILVWVGGMVFAHFFLRPAVAALEPPQRLRLMLAVLRRFFAVVTVVSLLAWLSGGWMIGRAAKDVRLAGGHFEMPLDWAVMATLGSLMVLIFAYIRWVPFRRLARAVALSDWPAGGAALQRLRLWVAVNLTIGLFIAVFTLML